MATTVAVMKEMDKTCVVSLPDDLITEILLRSPVKSLARFKSVCKKWYSLITNPTFAKSQLQHSTRYYLSSSHLIVRSDNTVFTLQLDLNDLQENTTKEIKGKFVPITPKFKTGKKNMFRCLGSSCNGIICIHACSTRKFHLWNPTTNESRVIPSPYTNYKCEDVYLFGFGYASAINDYKVVLVVEYYHPFLLKKSKFVYVYSSRHSMWTEFELPSSLKLLQKYNFYLTYSDIMPAVSLNDSLHWVVNHSSSEYYDVQNTFDHYILTFDHYILKFDLIDEVFKRSADLTKIHRSDLKEKRHLLQTNIGVTRDNNLYVCQLYNEIYRPWSYGYCVEGKPDVVEMRVLDDKRNSWKKKYRLEGKWNNIEDNHDMLEVTSNDKVIIFKKRGLPDHMDMGNLLIFDGRQGRSSYIHVKNEYCKPYSSGVPVDRVVNYVQSLISPYSI